MTDSKPWLTAVRRSHDRLRHLVEGRNAEALERQSAAAEWTVAQVLSHLGSQAEIFSTFVDAAVTGSPAPGREMFGPIWERWNRRSSDAQARDSIAANEALVTRLEGLGPQTLDGLPFNFMGRTVDGAGLLRMRLSEHAVHTWDVAVAFDARTEVDPEPVELLIDALGDVVDRTGRPPAQPLQVGVTTTTPSRHFVLHAGADGVRLEASASAAGGALLELPGEAFLRLVYGRLSDAYPARGPVRAEGVTLGELQALFPGL